MRGAGTVFILIALVGCAHKAPPRAVPLARVETTRPEPRLGVLPPDNLLFGDVAAALGERFRHVRIGGTAASGDGIVMAKVSMEVAQLSLECVAPTNDCYVAVGKFLQVDRLLWGQISHDHDQVGVKVTVVLLDVGLGTPIGRAERSFSDHAAAIEGLQRVVDEATRAPAKPTPTHSPTVLSKSEGSQ